MPRWARGRKDANHDELIDAVVSCGWDVTPTYQLRGFVDAVAWHPTRGVALLEFKAGKNTTTAAQDRLREKGWPIVLLRTRAEAIAWATAERTE